MNTLIFFRKFIHFGKNLVSGKKPKTMISINHINNEISGKNVLFGEDCTIINSKFGCNNKIGSYSYLYNVEYGEFTYNSVRTTLINCSIGKFCSIAQNVSVGLGRHPLNEFVSTHPCFYSVHKQCGRTLVDKQHFNEMGFVEIGNDVWLGADSIILDDVKIGNGAVIAANSVVVDNIPAYAIVGGTPAKIIKYRFTVEEIDFLEKFKWWDKSEEWLIEHNDSMRDIKLLQNYK